MNNVYIIGRDELPQLVRLEEGESLQMTLAVLPGTSADVSMEIDAEGPGCAIDIAGLYLCTSDENVSINILVKHDKGGCDSHQLFKGIVGGHARASFDGLIYVAADAQKTKAYQENHTILLTDSARVESRPQLEIYADDVECSHGSTSGFLNADEQFYMRSRGIPEREAQRLQKIAFIAPVVKRLPEKLAQEIYENID